MDLTFSGWSMILTVASLPAISHKIAILIKIILRGRSSILRSTLRVASFCSPDRDLSPGQICAVSSSQPLGVNLCSQSHPETCCSEIPWRSR